MRSLFLAALLLTACGPSANPTRSESNENTNVGEAGNAAEAPLNPPAPGTPGGLPDDRAPVSEAPFSETSAQGAANVLQSYFALIEQRRFGEAWRLWADGGRASGASETDFGARFAGYREYHANIGAPGEIEGAAGSLYVEVPVQVYGRRADGTPFSATGPATLRRVNDVPGSTEAQRRWHISAIAIAEPR